MLHFEINEFFYGFFLVVAIFAIFFILRIRRKKILRNFGNIELIEALYPDYSKYKPYIKTILVLLSLSALIVSLANPLLGTKLVQAKRQGVDVVVALDVSNSMKAEDIKPNRLERAKQMIYKLIDKLINDRIGLIVFAGESYVQLPLTTDYGAAKLFTSYVDTDIIPLQGTAIGSAIELAVEKFNFDEQRKKALIIITDGENHEDDALGAAKLAASKNFIIHTIGMGTLAGGPIPIYRNGTNVGFLKDTDGSVVTTKVDPVMLEQIAVAGGGEFVLNSGVDPDLSKIVEKIAQMEKKEYETKIFSSFESQFQYPLALAIVLLFVEVFITEKKNKYLAKLNLFVQSKAQK